MKPLLIAQLCAHSTDGHGRHRIHGPGRQLSRLPGVTVVDCDSTHRHAEWLFESADAVVLHGINADMLPTIHRRRVAGRVTTFEACDDYFDVQAWNPHVAHWLDRTLHDQFWHVVAAVDAVQTSTPALADRWRPRARRVVVFDNGLDDVPPLSPARDRPFTVGWAGSLTHLADWFQTAPVLEKWVRANPGTRLAAMTDARAAGFVNLPADRYHFRPAGSWDEYSRFLTELDVGVVPLLPSPFNRGRTDLKFLEYAAHGVVGLYANAPPYSTTVEHARTGLLFRDDAELLAGLDRLLADRAFLYQLREAAHGVARTRTTAPIAAARLEFYRSLLGTEATNPPLPEELLAAGSRDGRYVNLPADEPERTVLRAQDRPATPEGLNEVRRVLARWPQYTAAERLVARMLNDLGRPAEAIPVALALATRRPDSPSAWAEVARGHLALRDYVAARHAADRALVANPSHPAAWAILTRVAEVIPDVGRTVVRTARHQPANYITALTAVPFLPEAERVARLGELLDEYADALMPAERVYAAAAFGQVLADVIDPRNPPDGAAALLRRAAAAFPESARLADALGRVLYFQGDPDGASVSFAQAEFLARVAETHQLEADGLKDRHLWQIGEYLQLQSGLKSDALTEG